MTNDVAVTSLVVTLYIGREITLDTHGQDRFFKRTINCIYKVSTRHSQIAFFINSIITYNYSL